MGTDPFGVEKSNTGLQWDKRHKRKQDPSTGRVLTGALLPGYHGAVAGKKGHKLRAMGNEIGGAVVGSVLPGPGTVIGGALGTDRAAYKGHYKKQIKKNAAESAFGVEH